MLLVIIYDLHLFLSIPLLIEWFPNGKEVDYGSGYNSHNG